MRNFIKKHNKICIIILLLFLIVIVPIIFNILFKIYLGIPFLVAEWSCGELLSYYGTLLAAFMAVAGVYYTLKYSRSNYTNEIHNRVRPFIAINSFRCRSKFNLWTPVEQPTVTTDNSDDNYYEEYKLTEIYYILEKGEISIKTRLNDRQKQILSQGGFDWKNDSPGKFSFCDVDLVSIPLELDNVGAGPAINLRIGINRINEPNPVYITPVNLKCNQTIYLHIYAENQTKENIGDYILSLCYADIYERNYRQDFQFSITEENSKIYGKFDFSSSQEVSE